ncbi:MAG: hypothetical protein KDB23_19120, partial [Planctomycetales bacterium]|nr:hypothetical protein [Planctomycetales bacterium]
WEHASIGMDDEAVVFAHDWQQLLSLLERREFTTGVTMLAERFVEGREFNLSILNGVVLPVAEILFDDYPADKPRIVGYAAKWDEESFEYRQTPRSFKFPSADVPLLDDLRELAQTCWHEFGLTGYARVDFRVDERGRPWILEINVNPCLSPDAGFAAALSEAAIEFPAAVHEIVSAAIDTTRARMFQA